VQAYSNGHWAELDLWFCFPIHKCFNAPECSYSFAGWNALNEQILQTCKELVDDAKNSSADLVFKETCLEILSRARNILTERQFKHLAAYASERMKERIPFELQEELLARR
jgi:hypothetical protein